MEKSFYVFILLGVLATGWFAYSDVRYPSYTLYPVITSKPVPTDQGWALETSRGIVGVPYEFYKRQQVGDRVGVVVTHDPLTHAEFVHYKEDE